MKQFYLSDFPRFDDHVDSIWLVDPSIKIEKLFMDEGFRSIKMAPPHKGWFLSEEDYTWFILKWG
jgi:hypothetical protein